ncbi:MAG: hypothetical protein Q4G59_11320, partial [Planctomycetia bacterium]|nr:hypothetical protein [Planctomycetia bacterium]
VIDYTHSVGKYKKSDSLFSTYIQYVLLSNDTQELARIKQISSTIPGFVSLLTAAHLFLRGKTKESLTEFKEARAVQKSANALFPPFFELLYIIAALASGQPLTQNLIASACLEYGKSTESSVWNVLMKLCGAREAGAALVYTYPQIYESSVGIPFIISQLLDFAAAGWYSKCQDKDLAVKELGKIANSDGKYDWPMTEAKGLLNKLRGTNMAEPAKGYEGVLANIVIFQGRWESLKDIIQQLSENNTSENDCNTSAIHDTRLTWRYDGDITPYEQKRRNNGMWTAGRRVAMERLYNDWRSWDYLTEQDKQMCRCLEASTYRNYYGYDETEYYFSDEAFCFLPGHPLVFSMKHPDQRLDFVLEKPALEVVRTDNKTCVVIKPFPEDEFEDAQRDGRNLQYPCVVITSIAKDRYQIVRYDKIHLTLARLLGSEGLPIPEDAEAEIGKVFRPLISQFALHIDSKTSELIGDISSEEMQDSDSRIHLHLVPENDHLSVDLLVYPFGESGSSCTPGKGAEILFEETNGQRIGTHRTFTKERSNLKALLEACPALNDANKSGNRYLFDDPASAFEFLSQLETFVPGQNSSIDTDTKSTKSKTRKKEKKSETQESSDLPVVIKWPQGHRIRVSSPASFGNLKLKI